MPRSGPMTTTVRIPLRFYEDHMDRLLPTPELVRRTKRHGWICAGDPALPELVNDAEYYAHPLGPDGGPPGLPTAARALLAAIAKIPFPEEMP